jgi:hypothetical protein
MKKSIDDIQAHHFRAFHDTQSRAKFEQMAYSYVETLLIDRQNRIDLEYQLRCTILGLESQLANLLDKDHSR